MSQFRVDCDMPANDRQYQYLDEWREDVTAARAAARKRAARTLACSRALTGPLIGTVRRGTREHTDGLADGALSSRTFCTLSLSG